MYSNIFEKNTLKEYKEEVQIIKLYINSDFFQ